MSLTKNTAWNLVGSIVPMLIGLASIPYLTSELGIEAFGVLTMVWALVGYFSLFDFGLGRAITQQIASLRAKKEESGIEEIVKGGIILTVMLGMAGGLILNSLTSKITNSWLGVSETLKESTHDSIILVAIGIPITTVASGLRGTLEGFEDFKSANILRIILGTGSVVLPVLAVRYVSKSLEYAVGSILVVRVVVVYLNLLMVNRKLKKGWRSKKLGWNQFKKLTGFGFWMTISNILSPIMVTADRFIISSIVGAITVAYYTVPFEVLIRFLIIPGALTAAFFPKIAYQLNTDSLQAWSDYKASIFIIAIALGILVFIYCCLGEYGIKTWMGQDFAEKSWAAAMILVIGISFNGIAQIPHATIQAVGDVRLTALVHMFEAMLYIPAVIICVKTLGINGAALAWSVRALFDCIIFLYLAQKVFKGKKQFSQCAK